MTVIAVWGRLPENLHQTLSRSHLELREAGSAGEHPVVLAVGAASVGAARQKDKGALIVGVAEPSEWAATLRAGAQFVVPPEEALLMGAVEQAFVIASERASLAAYQKAEALVVPGSKLAELEQAAILAAMRASHGSTARAAAMLDISVRKVQYKLHEYGMPPTRKRAEAEARWGSNGAVNGMNGKATS